jgi:yeast amino acid transporter
MNVFLSLGLTVIPIMLRLIVDWKSGPAFRKYYELGDFGRFIGFWAACCQAVFSYLGVEIIGIVAEETERQRETLPRAARRVAYRAILYHVGAVFVLGLNVSANDPILEIIETQNYSSPFVLMVARAGIPALGQIINAVTVIALLGVANTRLYVSVCYAFARG